MKRNLLIKAMLCAFVTLLLCSCNDKTIEPPTPEELGEEQKAALSGNHLMFTEVCYIGSYTTQEMSDGYIVIHNPTNEPIEIKDYAIATTVFSPANRIEFSGDDTVIMNSYIGASNLIAFPEDAEAIPAGGYITVTAVANNVASIEGYETMFDLSDADYQWCNKKQAESVFWCLDGDKVPYNEEIPVMKTMLLNSAFFDENDDSYFSISGGFFALCLVKLEESAEDIMTNANDYLWEYIFVNAENGGHAHAQTGSCILLPKEWVTDVVSICPENSMVWSCIPDGLDAGSKGVIQFGEHQSRGAGKSIFRRHNGKCYEDTNNSTDDFEIKDASLKSE